MSRFRTIKELVFDHVRRKTGKVDYRALTEEVLTHFPTSAWKRTHWAWYRNQILRGRFTHQFSEEERRNLGSCPVGQQIGLCAKPPVSRGPRGPAPKDEQTKAIGDKILEYVRTEIQQAAGENQDLRFRINRWVFSRMLQEEIRLTRPIKKMLWESGQRRCQACGETFRSLKGAEIHRKNPVHGYSVENCELLCRDCHQELGSTDRSRQQ